MRRRLAVLVAIAALSAACSGDDSSIADVPPDGDAAELSDDPQVFVGIPDEAQRATLAAAAADGIELIGVEDLGRVGDGDLLFVGADPSQPLGSLAGAVEAGAALTLVPASVIPAATFGALGENAAAELVMLLAGDDTLATYEVVEIDGGVARVVISVDEERLTSTVGGDHTDSGDEAPEALPSPEVIWSSEVGFIAPSSIPISRSLVTDEVVVSLALDGTAYAFDRSTGAELWTIEVIDAAGQRFAAGAFLLASGDLAIVSGGPRDPVADAITLLGVDLLTGEVVWEAPFWSLPIVHDDGLFLWSPLQDPGEPERFGMVSIDAQSGDTRWTTELDGTPGVGLGVVVDGVVYAGGADGTLFGFDTATGEQMLAETGVAPARIGSVAALGPDALVFGADDGVIRAYSVADRALLWDYATGSVRHTSLPAVADGLVVTGGFDGYVHAIDAASGEAVWTTFIARAIRGDVVSSPAVVDGVVYIGGGNGAPHVHALDLETGELIWRYETGSSVPDSPVVVDGVVYVQTFGSFVALRAAL